MKMIIFLITFFYFLYSIWALVDYRSDQKTYQQCTSDYFVNSNLTHKQISGEIKDCISYCILAKLNLTSEDGTIFYVQRFPRRIREYAYLCNSISSSSAFCKRAGEFDRCFRKAVYTGPKAIWKYCALKTKTALYIDNENFMARILNDYKTEKYACFNRCVNIINQGLTEQNAFTLDQKHKRRHRDVANYCMHKHKLLYAQNNLCIQAMHRMNCYLKAASKNYMKKY